MAPFWPEEVDVFSVPHKRMKTLVNGYKKMIMKTDFRDEHNFSSLLHTLFNVFTEFKAHEHIENVFIMKRLKSKLKAASENSTAVCNCHSDNRLTNMLDMVLSGYKLTQKSDWERQRFGQELIAALDNFTDSFLPHMEEEEEVFQPLLMKYFTYEELKELKENVIHQHAISKTVDELSSEGKYVEDSMKAEERSSEKAETQTGIKDLPDEMYLKIFSYLNPKELAQSGQVSKHWFQLSRDPSLWTKLTPVHWARGNWSFYAESVGGVDGQGFDSMEPTCDSCDESRHFDEDADIDESDSDSDSKDKHKALFKNLVKEMCIVEGLIDYILPYVGSGVKVLDLAFCRVLKSKYMRKLFKLCPNLEVVDFSYTDVTDASFFDVPKELLSSILHLDLTACTKISDETLFYLTGSQDIIMGEDSGTLFGNSIAGTLLYLFESKLSTSADFDKNEKFVTINPYSHQFNNKDWKIIKENGTDVTNTHKRESKETIVSCKSLASKLRLENKNISSKSSTKASVSCCNGKIVNDQSKNACCFTKTCTDINSSSLLDIENVDSRDGSHDSLNSRAEESYDNSFGKCENRRLKFLSLNGVSLITDEGLSLLADSGGMPNLEHLDLSGCRKLTGVSIRQLVSTCPSLEHSNLYYCNNIHLDPYPTSASGCRNLECVSRVCCTGIRE